MSSTEMRQQIDDLLSLAKKKADHAEVYLTLYEETPVLFEANRLKQLHTTQGNSVALRIIREGRIGFATSTDLTELDGLIDRAVAVSEFGAEAKFELPSQSPYPPVEVYSPEVDTITMNEMVGLGDQMLSQVREHTPEIMCEATVTKSTVSQHLANSRGGEFQYKKSTFAIGIEGMIVNDTDMLFVGEMEASCRPIRQVHNVTDRVITQLENAKQLATISGGNLPVLFTPTGVASALTTPLCAAFNGRVVVHGASPLQDRIGSQAFNQALSIYDDATLDYCPRGRPCDDEGIASRRTPLIEAGVVKNFLYDLQTAGMAGQESTGSGSRGGGLPSPRTSAIIIEPGDVTFDDVVADMKDGLVVEQLMGASQTNVLGGDFSGNVLLGYKVENGKLVGRVKDVVVSGNIHELLAGSVTICRERRWLGGTMYIPAFYFPQVGVASKA
ncbi:MAG: TldD/PmbA family protein [Chloroflexota bacterium]|nr:TldD/PmbA family protein [Chloroflexota bacterium]